MYEDDEDDVDLHKERFLAPGAPTGRFQDGYCDDPVLGMRHEPQALTRGEWRDHIRDRSELTELQRRKFEEIRIEQARRLLDFEERLVSAHSEARKRCVDVSSEVRLVRHMQSTGKAVRHLEKRLLVIERKVWRMAA